jgi:hypothetical protein
MIDDNEDNVVEVLDNSEIENGTSLICKVEKIAAAKTATNSVSPKRKKRNVKSV